MDYTGGVAPKGSTSTASSQNNSNDDNYSSFGIDLEEGKKRLVKEIKKQLAEICSRGIDPNSLVQFRGGICPGDKSGFEALTETIQSALN